MEAWDICILAHPADAGTAERLSASLKSYRLPRQLKRAGEGYTDILLDVAGEAFSREVAARLAACRRLVVLCSPDARDYAPILDRLRYYETTLGRKNIIAVILRGEPIEAFPAFFIEERLVRHIRPDGSVEERMETLEPVASDLRASSRRQARALMRYETVRIVASVLGLEPDMLQRRHARRARRRAISVAVIACTLGLAVSGVFAYFSIRARNEGRLAAAMNEESLRAVDRLVEELPERFADNPEALAYVQETIDEVAAMLGGDGAAQPPLP